jgi:hypothetical protein
MKALLILSAHTILAKVDEFKILRRTRLNTSVRKAHFSLEQVYVTACLLVSICWEYGFASLELRNQYLNQASPIDLASFNSIAPL